MPSMHPTSGNWLSTDCHPKEIYWTPLYGGSLSPTPQANSLIPPTGHPLKPPHHPTYLAIFLKVDAHGERERGKARAEADTHAVDPLPPTSEQAGKDSSFQVLECHKVVTQRESKFTNFVEWRTHKLVYRRYAGLFFTLCVDVNDNELACLEAIHLFVEVFVILDEYFLAGEVMETSKVQIDRSILAC
eukprot:767704-Hanusia_phi.AAC.9